MVRFYFFTPLVAIILLWTKVETKTCSLRCYPGEDCFPTATEIAKFRKTLKGYVILPSNTSYKDAIHMHNKQFAKFPAIVVMVLSIGDIQNAMLFARKFNLHVTVKSSGHDYIGRSTWTGSFQINLSLMKKMSVKLMTSRRSEGELTVETGANWQEIYQKLDQYDRIVVGGSSQTVTSGGYTQGGGHSILSRMLGLAVDQILEINVITTNGSIIRCTNTTSDIYNPDGSSTTSNDNSLFWALRGGGGGTFGIVASYVFKLYKPPPQFVKVTMSYPLSINGNISVGIEVMKFYSTFLKGMPKEWGGYFFLSNTNQTLNNDSVVGTMSFLFCHFGEWNTTSRKYMDSWNSFHPEWRLSYTAHNVSSFWAGFGSKMTDSPWSRVYVTGSFIQNQGINRQFTDFLVDLHTKRVNDAYPMYACVGTHLGGKVSEVDWSETPTHPGFRNASLCLGCVVAIPDVIDDGFYVNKGGQLSDKLISFGYGTYVNEASEYMINWKSNYWGDHYDKLLQIKKRVDPNNYLTCHHCVGSDL